MEVVDMKKILIPFLTAFVVLAVCGCDDGGGGLQEAAPRVEAFFVGDTGEAPGNDAFLEMTESGELAIHFGEVDVGLVARQYLFVKNTGKSDLKLFSMQMQAGSSPDFLVSCLDGGDYRDNCPYSDSDPLLIQPGQNLVVQVSYAPAEVGADTGGFTLQLNAADHQTLTVVMDGEGVTPEIQVCITECIGDQTGAGCSAGAEACNDQKALQVDFGDADLDTQLSRNVVVRNIGDQPLEIGTLRIASGDFNQFRINLNNNDLPGILAAGAEATIMVIYDPGIGGEHHSVLEIVSDDVNEGEIHIALNGRGMAPRLCPEPLVVDFGNVATGECLVQTFTITSCGLLDLVVENVLMNTDSSPDFALVNLPTVPLPLGPGATQDISVEYCPQEMGSDHGGVDLFSNDPASDPGSHLTGTVSLLGTSVPRACEIAATPFAVNFGGVVQNNTEEVDLVVSNQGTDVCTLERVEISANTADNEFAIVSAPAADTILNPGDVVTVVLSYTPINLGVDTGTLSLFGNDKDGNEIRVDLNGEGVETAECDVQIDPGTLLFGTVKLYHTKPMFVQLTNQGLSDCQVTYIGLEQPDATGRDFSITTQPPLPLTLERRGQAGSQAEIEITFAPQREYLQFRTLKIEVDDNDLGDRACLDANSLPIPHEACISLMAFSKESEIEIVPAELDFGVVTVGCNSPEQCVTVYNLGSNAVSIDDIYLEDPADPNFDITSAPMTPGTLGGGNSFQVCVRYHPQDINVHRSVLYIELAGDETHTVPLFGRGTDISDQTDVFHQPDKVKSDVLWVVDCSGSMGDNQQNLADNFGAFIAWATTLDVDFHIAVVTTEVEPHPGYTGTPPRVVNPGELIEVTGRPKIITNNTPDLIDAFTDLIMVGDSCSNTEAGLQGAHMALSEPLVSDPAKNLGFLREDAKLYIICVSDEPDQSQGSVDFYVDFFSSIKGYRNTEMMKVSAISSEHPGGRYCEVANRTGGICESIYTNDWNQVLANLGIDAFSAIREFPLSRPADSSTITVTVDGVTVPEASSHEGADGWTYDPTTNTIYFGDDVVPDKGARIEVSYTATCL
jgi:hypothetical protein